MKNYNNIPCELRSLKQWVCSNNDKIPKDPNTGRNAKVNDPTTWGSFEKAIKACNKYGFENIGFVFTKNDPYFGVDLDDVFYDKAFCDEFADTLKTYCEYSTSGTGLHFICRGNLPEGNRRHNNVEMYSEVRYFICTGDIYNPDYTQIRDCTEEIKPLYSKYFPHKIQSDKATTTDSDRSSKSNTCVSKAEFNFDNDVLINLAINSRCGRKFTDLFFGFWESYYETHSQADIAFCIMLAYWSGRNKAQIDSIFRSSCLMRPKWDEYHSKDKTYGEITIDKAVAACKNTFIPNNHRS